MHVHGICQGLYQGIPSEDVTGHAEVGNTVVAWVIDGASTISESPFTTFSGLTDAGWFARRISDILKVAVRVAPINASLVESVLACVRNDYRCAGGFRHPAWAWPLAAASIVRVAVCGVRAVVDNFIYADCFTTIGPGAGVSVPGDGHLVVPGLGEKWLPCSGLCREDVAAMRANRIIKQCDQPRGALSMNPRSARGACCCSEILTSGGGVLIGSDGLSRVWGSYGIISAQEALALVQRGGLFSLLEVLRSHEASRRVIRSEIKARDDAAGVYIKI